MDQNIIIIIINPKHEINRTEIFYTKFILHFNRPTIIMRQSF